MENCDARVIAAVVDLSLTQIAALLKTDRPGFRLTLSIVNLLHNLLEVGSLPVPSALRESFEAELELVDQLLRPAAPHARLNRLLQRTPRFIRMLARACP